MPLRSSGRSWRATARRASRSTRRSRRSTQGRSPRSARSRSVPRTTRAPSIARAAEVAAELLDGVLTGEPQFTPQPGEGVTYAEKITAADRELDWSRPPQELFDKIRALSPHIGARGELDGRRLTIWRARLEDGKLVPVEVQPEGKRRMGYDEFLRGLR